MSATYHPEQHGKQKQPQNIRTRWAPGARESAAGSEHTGCPWALGQPAGVDGRGRNRHTAPTERRTGCYCLSFTKSANWCGRSSVGFWLPAGPCPRPLSLHLQEGACAWGTWTELTWILPGTPVLSIRLATLTVFPQMSYCGRRAPITPATTGPTLIPGR